MIPAQQLNGRAANPGELAGTCALFSRPVVHRVSIPHEFNASRHGRDTSNEKQAVSGGLGSEPIERSIPNDLRRRLMKAVRDRSNARSQSSKTTSSYPRGSSLLLVRTPVRPCTLPQVSACRPSSAGGPGVSPGLPPPHCSDAARRKCLANYLLTVPSVRTGW